LTFDWSNINFLSYLENPGDLSHISKLLTLLRKPSHTHALHELSLLLKKFCLQEIYAHWLLNSFLYACVFLTSYLTVFTGLDTCVCWFLVEDLTLFFSLLFDFGYGFSLILCLSFVLLRQKGGVFFLFWTGNVFPNRSSIFFYLRMAKRGSLLVFYVGNILVDKNKHFM
jgi:hypothetical protein